MFITFSGYSNGYIDLEINYNPTSPECVTSNVFIRDFRSFSIITHAPNNIPDRQTLCTNIWLVNERHLGISRPFENGTYVFTARAGSQWTKESFPSGIFKMIASSSFILQQHAHLNLTLDVRERDHVHNMPISIPFAGTEYKAHSSTKVVGFLVSYTGYDQFPVFALNIQVTQESYYLCLPSKGYAVHEKTDKAINVQIPHAWPKQQFHDTQVWWNYRSGGCRAILIDHLCSNATNTKVAEIHYEPTYTYDINPPFEIDISLRKTPLCSPQCSLTVAI
jgi:hypothetical protein